MSYPPVLIKPLKRLDAVVDPSEIDMILRRYLIVKRLGARQVVSRQEINIVDIRRDIRDDEQIELPVLLYPAATVYRYYTLPAVYQRVTAGGSVAVELDRPVTGDHIFIKDRRTGHKIVVLEQFSRVPRRVRPDITVAQPAVNENILLCLENSRQTGNEIKLRPESFQDPVLHGEHLLRRRTEHPELRRHLVPYPVAPRAYLLEILIELSG